MERLTSLSTRACDDDEQAGATRYRMLETVRQYALDRLREAARNHSARLASGLLSSALGSELPGEVMGPKAAGMARPDRERARQPAGCAHVVN